jgi:hypothetical protein
VSESPLLMVVVDDPSVLREPITQPSPADVLEQYR